MSLFPAGHDAPFPIDEPIDIIPRSCQLTTDVPQVTQLLNMTKLRQTEIKFGGHPLNSTESGMNSSPKVEASLFLTPKSKGCGTAWQ